jgi:hypothetical protein
VCELEQLRHNRNDDVSKIVKCSSQAFYWIVLLSVYVYCVIHGEIENVSLFVTVNICSKQHCRHAHYHYRNMKFFGFNILAFLHLRKLHVPPTSSITALYLINSATDSRLVELQNGTVIAVRSVPGLTAPSFNVNATVRRSRKYD